MNTNTYTIAVLRAKPGKADALISALEDLAAETRKEEGAIEYGFIRDQKTPDIVLSYEKSEHILSRLGYAARSRCGSAREDVGNELMAARVDRSDSRGIVPWVLGQNLMS